MNALLLSLLITANSPVQAAPAPAVETYTEHCLLGMADNLDAQLILRATELTFSIYQPSSTGHSIETLYEKAPIALFQEPTEAPFLSCQDEDAQIVVWENIALINGQYFSIENATAIHQN